MTKGTKIAPEPVSVNQPKIARIRSGLRQLSVNPVTYCWIGLVVAFVALCKRLALANEYVLSYWFSSDMLFPVHLFVDWFRDGYPLSGWRFAVAPCWIPDMPLTAIGYLLTRNAVLANLLDGLLQFALLMLGFQMCWRAVGLRETRLADCITLLAGIAMTLVTAWRIEIYYPTTWKLFMPQTHISTLVIVMFGAAICLRLLRGGLDRRTSRILVATLAVVSILGGMSDPLYFPQMALAMTVAALLFAWIGVFRFRTLPAPLLTALVGTWAGRMLDHVLFSVTDVSAKVSIDRFLAALDTFMRGFATDLHRGDLLHVSVVLWLLTAAGAFLHLVRRLALGRLPVEDPPGRDRMVVFFLVFSAFSGLASAAAIIIGGANGLVDFKFYRWSADHYLHSMFYEAAFGWCLLVALLIARRRIQWSGRSPLLYAGMAAVVVLPAAWALSIPSAAIPLHLYQPKWVTYLDSQAERYGLKTGAAGYWNARPLTLLSRKGLRATSLLPSMMPNSWVSNDYWYRGTPDGSKKAPVYSFVVLDEPAHRKAAVEQFGAPAADLKFREKALGMEAGIRETEILIYTSASRAAQRANFACASRVSQPEAFLKRAGDRLEIPASCLSGSVGDVVENTRVAKEGSGPGLLTYGPYLTLPAGQYTVTMRCQVARRKPGPAATWDLGYFCCGSAPAVKLGGGSVGDGAQEMRAHISVTPELAKRGLEFRVDYTSAEQMVLKNLTIEREP